MGGRQIHTISIPLRANARDIQIVSEALEIVGKLRNAALGDMLARIDAMRSDPRWREARKKEGREKNKIYRELRKQYAVSSHDMVRICHGHWKASGWMGDRIGSRIATALAPELWQNLEEYLYARASRPRYKKSAERNIIWNNDNASGLLLRDGGIKWSVKTSRKSLDIPLDMKSISLPRREWLEERLDQGALRRAGIKREVVRGRVRLFALITLEGAPYREEKYFQEASDANDVVGLDLGPTWLALVSGSRAEEIEIASPKRILEEDERRKKERRQKRAADRSRKAANGHARRRNGTSIKGVRQPQRSKRGKKREQLVADTKRRDRINRKRERGEIIRKVISEGKHIALEDLDYRSWQKSFYGRRMGITSPGDFIQRLAREAELLGGSVTLIDPYAARASQKCLCGVHTGKKPLSQRKHECPDCGLSAPRDLVSAALLRELALAGEETWDKELAEASGTKRQMIDLLSSRRTSLSSDSAPSKRREKQDREEVVHSSKVLLCEKEKSDPEDKSHSSLDVPTSKQPEVRLKASRKAAVSHAKSNDYS